MFAMNFWLTDSCGIAPDFCYLILLIPLTTINMAVWALVSGHFRNNSLGSADGALASVNHVSFTGGNPLNGSQATPAAVYASATVNEDGHCLRRLTPPGRSARSRRKSE